MITKADRQLETVEQFIARLFPCQPPCDSYGVCGNCNDASLIKAGAELERKKSAKLVESLESVAIPQATYDKTKDYFHECVRLGLIIKQALEEYEK